MTGKIEFETHIDLLQHLTGMHYMFIPSSIVTELGGGFSRRLIATVNNQISWQCGLMSLREGHAYISITNKRMKELGVKLGDNIELKLEEDPSKYGVEMPEELQAVLDLDPEGYARFEALKPAMQRYTINYVSSVKNTDKRIERALLLINNLKTLKPGQEDFREMLGKPPRE